MYIINTWQQEVRTNTYKVKCNEIPVLKEGYVIVHATVRVEQTYISEVLQSLFLSYGRYEGAKFIFKLNGSTVSSKLKTDFTSLLL